MQQIVTSLNILRVCLEDNLTYKYPKLMLTWHSDSSNINHSIQFKSSKRFVYFIRYLFKKWKSLKRKHFLEYKNALAPLNIRMYLLN